MSKLQQTKHTKRLIKWRIFYLAFNLCLGLLVIILWITETTTVQNFFTHTIKMRIKEFVNVAASCRIGFTQ